MYRVFDTEKKQWVTDNIYMMPNGKLLKMKKSTFGRIKILLELPQERYVYHEDIGLYDKRNDLIFIGDYIKAKVADDRTVIGVVTFARELSSYIILCVDCDEYFTLGESVCKYIEIIGNVFDGYKEDEEDGQQTLQESEA